MKKIYLLYLLLGLSTIVTAQERLLLGTVKDEKNEPLLGVTVMIEGTGKGVATDINGSFSLEVKNGQVLTFSSVGYQTQHHVVTPDLKKLDISLRLDVEEIPEVVVVGFGKKQAVKELTGAVSKLDNVADNNSISVDKVLLGRVAGVQGGTISGQPGSTASVRIRGVASVNGRNEPVYVIDGVRVSHGDHAQNTMGNNVLAGLNNDDIESVTILKDAVSTAVYGADTGAGVVIITTKSGKKGAADFHVSSEIGLVSRAAVGEKPLTTEQWLSILYDAYLNSEEGSAAYPSKEALLADLQVGNISAGTGSILQSIYNQRHTHTDWRKLVENNMALSQKINATVSGGNDKLSYYSSLGYLKEDGIVKENSFERVTSSNKIDFQATSKLRLSTNIQLSYANTLAQPEGAQYSNPVYGQYMLRPTERAYNSDGSFNYGQYGMLSNGTYNIAALQQLNHNKNQTIRALANFQLDYQVAKNLLYKFVFAPEYIDIGEDVYKSPIHGDGFLTKGEADWFNTRIFSFNLQNILSYDLAIKEKNHLSASLIQEAHRTDQKNINAVVLTAGSNKLKTLSSFITPASVSGTRDLNSREGYALTLHYDYDKLFLLDLSGRQDRLSNFWKENRTGYFYSVGVGVDLARLDFFRKTKQLSQLKFSTSYGRVGNMVNASPYATYRYSFNYDNQAAGIPIGVNNPDLHWETLYPLNIGLDVGFFSDRITLSVAYFQKKTKDMIFSLPLSAAQGSYTATKQVNIGEMENKGWELAINAELIKNEEGLNWELGGHISTLSNKITQMYDDTPIKLNLRVLQKGESIGAFYLKKWAGVDPNTGAPLWYKNGKDGETTSVYSEAKEAIQGSYLASLYGGFNTKISYKNVSLLAQFAYGFGNKLYDSSASLAKNDGKTTYLYPGYASQVGSYWTPQNRNSENPKPIWDGNALSSEDSTRYLYDGDYLRLQTLKLSYDFPTIWLEGTYLKQLQFYVLGDNLWTYNFDKRFKGDPEAQADGRVDFILPTLRTLSFGMNINF